MNSTEILVIAKHVDMGKALRGLLSEIDEVGRSKCKAADASFIMPDCRYDTLQVQLQTSYRFPAVFQNAMTALINECNGQLPGDVYSLLGFQPLDNHESFIGDNVVPLSHRIDDWMHKCMFLWERDGWLRSDFVDRQTAMRIERERCAAILQRCTFKRNL